MERWMEKRMEIQHLLTFEDVWNMGPDEKGELDAGRWVPVTYSTYRHGEVVVKVTVLLYAFARQHPGWRVSAGDIGSKLRHNPDTLRCPDVAIVRADRFPTGRGVGGWLEGAPDVAVEVIGDSQSMSELVKKALEYLRAGGQLVWILDPEPERLVLVTPDSRMRVMERDEILDGGDVLPGFSCRVAEFFE